MPPEEDAVSTDRAACKHRPAWGRGPIRERRRRQQAQCSTGWSVSGSARMMAWAAARRAMGTRYGEQDT